MKFYFDKFKNYARYLLNNKSILDELMLAYFGKVRNSNIPMMPFLEHLPVDQHKKITDKNIESFLQHSLDDSAFEDAVVVIDQWKSNDLLGLPREEIEVADILTVTNFRKQLYVNFLEKYTQDITQFRAIVAELDEFHMQFQKYAFDSYVDIHQEEFANENKFTSSLINNSIDGILAFDKQFKVTAFNQVLERWHGVRKEEVIGKDIFEVFSAYKGSLEGSPLEQALEGKKTFIQERPFQDRKGYYEANIVPLYDNKGLITGGIIITHDITRRKEAEEEIKETKHLLQEITDAVPNVIYVSDFATKQNIFVNKEISSLLGYSPEEIKSFGRGRLEQLIHPDDLPALEKQADEISRLKEGEVADLNVRIKHKNGRWRWIRTKSKIFHYDKKGKPLQTIRVLEDITGIIEAQQTIQQQNEELAAALEELQASLEELQTAEEQLREMNEELEYRVERRTKELAESERNVKRREEQLRLITDSLPVLISYLRHDKTYEFANKAYEGTFQISREEIIGKHIKEVLGEKAYSNSQPLIDHALTGEFKEFELLGYSGDAAPLIPVILTPSMGPGSENTMS